MSIIKPRRNRLEAVKKDRRSLSLAKKLVQICRQVAITEHDCGTNEGLRTGVECEGTVCELGLAKAIVGRVSLRCILNPLTGQTIVEKNELVTPEIARRIEAIGLKEIVVRSPLTCQTEHGVCQCCYGWDLSTTALVDIGTRVGMLAAQAISESTLQIPDRYSRSRSVSESSIQSDIFSRAAGVIRFSNSRIVRNASGASIVMSCNATAAIYDDNDRWLTTYDIPIGAELHVTENEAIERGQRICSWNPHAIPVLSNASGWVQVEDVVEGGTAGAIARTLADRTARTSDRLLPSSSSK